MWDGSRDEAWLQLTSELGIPTEPAIGERVDVTGPDSPTLGGTVADSTPWRISLVLDKPVPGTAIIAAEGMGDTVSVSIWSYLYGIDGEVAAERDELLWQNWLDQCATKER